MCFWCWSDPWACSLIFKNTYDIQGDPRMTQFPQGRQIDLHQVPEMQDLSISLWTFFPRFGLFSLSKINSTFSSLASFHQYKVIFISSSCCCCWVLLLVAVIISRFITLLAKNQGGRFSWCDFGGHCSFQEESEICSTV